MNGLDFLNLVIGLIFIYLIYSIACTTIWELIVNILHLRGKMLRNWLVNTFKGKLGEDILKHPIFKGLSNSDKKLPNYISSALFTDILSDIIVNAGDEEVSPSNKPVNINSFKESLEKVSILDEGLKRVFLQYINDASGDFQKVKEKIGNWFDEAQEGLIGSFKKKLQLWIFVIAVVLVCATNADTIQLGTYLYNNPEAREVLANKADMYIQDSAIINIISTTDTSIFNSLPLMEQQAIKDRVSKNLETIDKLNNELKESNIPLGWTSEELSSLNNPVDILKKIGGLLLSIFAVSLGSPFWFDILNKLSNLRSSGNKPKTILEEQEITTGAQKPSK